MRKILAIFIYLVWFPTVSQEIVKNVKLDLSKKANVFQIVEEEKKQVTLFFSEYRKLRCIRFDEHFNVIDSITSGDYVTDKEDNIVGYSLSDNNYWTYWPSSSNKEITALCFDFNAKKISRKSFRLAFEKEKEVTKITIGNVFYVITVVKNTSIVNFYMFKDGAMNKRTIDLSDKRFLDEDNKIKPLSDLFTTPVPLNIASFQTVTAETPASLGISMYGRKLYVFGNTVVFSMDVSTKFTQTFTVNLSDFSVTQKVYSQPYFEDKLPNPDDNPETFYIEQSANSFMLKDAIVQIKTMDGVTKISAKKINGDELKSFRIGEFEDIKFKNSDIYQENGSVKSLKILDKPSQFSKKMKSSTSALSLYESNDKLIMVVGGVSVAQQTNDVMIGGMLGGIAGALIVMALSPSPNYSTNNLNAYKGKNVVYMNCLFDKDFNHIEGDLKKTGFDELRAFAERREELTSVTVFKLNSYLYMGGYDVKNTTYWFYKFKD